MAGIQGRDYQVGDHAEMQWADFRQRIQKLKEGTKVPTDLDVKLALRKMEDGKYPYWEEQLAIATVAAARARGMRIPGETSDRSDQPRRNY